MNLFNLNRKQLISLTILFFLCVIFLKYLDGFLTNDVVKNGIVSFELAKDFTKSKQILDS